jgi:hypothetical protein
MRRPPPRRNIAGRSGVQPALLAWITRPTKAFTLAQLHDLTQRLGKALAARLLGLDEKAVQAMHRWPNMPENYQRNVFYLHCLIFGVSETFTLFDLLVWGNKAIRADSGTAFDAQTLAFLNRDKRVKNPDTGRRRYRKGGEHRAPRGPWDSYCSAWSNWSI